MPAKRKIQKTPAMADMVPKKASQLITRKNTDGTISVLDLNNDQFFYNIDGVAAECWELVNGKVSLAGIEAKVAKKHSPPPDQLRDHLIKFFKELVKFRLIELT